MSKGFQLYGYTDTTVFPKFDLEGNKKPTMKYEKTSLENVGTIQQVNQELEFGWREPFVTRDFHLKACAGYGCSGSDDLLKIRLSIKGSDGHAEPGSHRNTLDQTSKFYPNYTISYGYVDTGPTIKNRAYVYVSKNHQNWMGDLLDDKDKAYQDLKVKDLVLPGSHDAGMYEILSSSNLVVKIIKTFINSLSLPTGLVSDAAIRIAINLAATQKERIKDQLRIGARFFDIRPAYIKEASSLGSYHIHGVIPGATFDDCLRDIKDFLSEHEKEVVFVQIKDDGIEKNLFTPLNKQEVTERLNKHFAEKDYEIVGSIADKHDTKLSAINAKLIVIMGKSDVNDSYSDDAYSYSLHDATKVKEALESTIAACSSQQFTMLQLQNTGSNYITAKKNIEKSIYQWTLVGVSDAGSILQYTKPDFDKQTYSWLVQKGKDGSMKKCSHPIILLNDFVEPALTSHAIALTKMRLK